MRLLLDANLSPRVLVQLSQAGYDVAHVADLDLLNAEDSLIFDHGVAEGYVVVTADSDFPMMLALRRVTSPSVILLRQVVELSADEHARLLLANLPSVTEDLERGVIVSLSPTRLTVRDLPISSSGSTIAGEYGPEE